MKQLIAALLILTTFTARAAVIPEPAKFESLTGTFELNASTVILGFGNKSEAETLAAMLRPATGLPLPIDPPMLEFPPAIWLRLNAAEMTRLGKEGYTLKVQTGHISITAATPAGLFYGAQTLRQLLPPAIFATTKQDGVKWEIPACKIEDKPRFGWRGFMLDSCRHFQNVTTVKQVIDLMAQYKLNRLHWHLTEDEAWRIEVPGYPELTAKGAWRRGREDGKEVERYGGFYSTREVKEIVAYARDRHIVVYPELEMPGHSTAAIYAYPQYSCDGKLVVPGAPGELGIGSFAANGRKAFCPSRAETYTFLQDVALRVSALFETPYIHIGADEVPREQWEKCPRCQALIKTENLKDNVGLQQYFGRKMTAFLRSHGKQPIYWGVDLERGIPDGIIVQGWHPGESALAARKGFHTINSDCTGTYFDFPQGPGDTGDGSRWLGRLPIEKVYAFNPVPADLTAEQAKFVMGSEAPLWTEYVPEHKVTSKMFPRLFAFAEALWSPAKSRKLPELQARMASHLDRLERMDVPYYGQRTGGKPIGSWTPQTLKPGDCILEWDATDRIRNWPGRCTVTFQFQKGQHALQIRRVSLLRDGQVVVEDMHTGLAGGRHENNSYALTIPDTPTGRFTIRATVAGLDGTDSTGEVLLKSIP